ncbi:hypothetical protein SLA2020_349270 [Shorea laevis]
MNSDATGKLRRKSSQKIFMPAPCGGWNWKSMEFSRSPSCLESTFQIGNCTAKNIIDSCSSYIKRPMDIILSTNPEANVCLRNWAKP